MLQNKRIHNDDFFHEGAYDEAIIKAEEAELFDAYLKEEAEKEAVVEAKTRAEIQEYFEEAEDEDDFPKKDRGSHAEKKRLDRKYRKKRANPELKKPWKRKKTWEHRNNCKDHVCVVRARQKELTKEIKVVDF